jgi:hypothetical protein
MVLLLCAVVFPSSPTILNAQNNELSGTFGVALSPDAKGLLTCGEAIICNIPPNTIGNLSIGPGFSWQATFARRLKSFKVAGLYLELPVTGSPSRNGPAFLINEYSSVFFTPSAQFKFLPGAGISPFASVGGGLAHFETRGTGANTWALQLGGGVDFRTPLRLLALRAEVRDYITGRPNIPVFGAITANHLQNLFAGGGVVLRF